MRARLQGLLLAAFLMFAGFADGLMDAMGPAGFALAGGALLAALAVATLPRGNREPRRSCYSVGAGKEIKTHGSLSKTMIPQGERKGKGHEHGRAKFWGILCDHTGAGAI